MADELGVIRTSEQDWLERLAKAYKQKRPTTLVDDAGIGIDPLKDSLHSMGKKAGLGMRGFAGVLVALGMGYFGVAIIATAFADPEPTSKLGLAIGAGAVMALGGGWGAIRILTGSKPPTVIVGPNGFRIEWE